MARDFTIVASYRQHVILAIALTGMILFLVAGLTWTGRLLRISRLDAQALVEKVAFPVPGSALEWPELQVQSVVPQPEELSTANELPTVILQVGWPAYPEQIAVLLVALDHDERRALSLLSQWSDARAAVAAVRQGAEVELRRRQSLDRVHAILIAEDYPGR